MTKNRYLLKLSGEVLKGSQSSGISFSTLDNTCKRLSNIIKKGDVELGFVVGGGNIFRGGRGVVEGYDRLLGDQVGMMATVINGLSLVERLRYYGVKTIIQSGVKIDGVVDLFDKDQVEKTFSEGGAVVFCGGIGNPYFSTDTTAVLRALQINATAVFKATKVDGIYDKDPEKFSDAKKYNEIKFGEIISNNLEVMDLTAILMMKKNNLKLMVFNMTTEGVLEDACHGKELGTIVKE
ncbi:MAG: UMP kinase [Spirochaetes bacterium GWD1_27_9]|nr:MAG: UMP kinase [Spirochaetes bacterium GWB1_27_13]OHD22107.1 MAG: UMP kinase [Spirochaetes bacterium GWC1_27_15]OHD28952.1 MAG: UMP kinase [Spirochaetes bacterium GWD1_27_9]